MEMGNGKKENGIVPEDIIQNPESNLLQNCQQVKNQNENGLSIYSQREEKEEIISDTKEFPQHEKRRGWSGLIFGIGIGIVVGVVIMQVLRPRENLESNTPQGNYPTQTTTDSGGLGQTSTMSVTVAPVELATVESTFDATGDVVAFDLLPILPQVNGLQIKQVLVEEGERVTIGMVMAILDDSVLKSQINQSKSQVESARSDVQSRKATYSSAKAGVERAIASREQAEADRDQIKAAIAQAQASKDEANAARRQAEASLEDANAAWKQTQASRNDAVAALKQAQASHTDALASVAQAEAQLGEAKANQEQAQREFERYQTLNSEGVVSAQELETRSTTVKTAQEGVRVADANLDSAQAKVNIADANIDSAQAKVNIAISNVSSAVARVESADANLSSTQAQLRSANAKVRSAKADVSSAQAEVDSALSNIDNAIANVNSNEASVQEKETQLGQTLVKAPADGIVAERIARVGDVTSSSKMLFSIIKDNQLELQLKVPETQLAQVKIGEKVKISSDADNRIKMLGVVREIAPLVDQESREATVKVDLPKSDLLRPGMFLRAAITTATNQGLKILAKAVLPQGDGKSIVYVLTDNNQVKAVAVEVGEILSNGSDLTKAEIEIRKGLKLGDRVVVAGAGYLKDGDFVTVIEQN